MPVEDFFEELPAQPSPRYYDTIKQMDWYSEGDTTMEHTQEKTVFRFSPPQVALLVATLVMIFAFALTPTGRSLAAEAWQAVQEVIGGQRFTRSDEIPFSGEEHGIAPTAFMTLEAAQADYGFALPTNLPEGYAFTEIEGYTPDGDLMGRGEAMVTTFDAFETITLSLTEQQDAMIFITTRDDVGLTLGNNVPIEEVTVNGQPAALFPTGAYNGDEYVISEGSYTLAWSEGGFRYELRADLSPEELIAIAESFEK